MSTRLCTCGVGDGDWPEDHTDRCDTMRPQIHGPAVPEAGTLPWLDRYTSTSGEIMTEVGVTQAQVLEFAAEWERRCWPILAEAVEEAGFDAVTAHRLLFNAANERLRAQLLTALGGDDDGKTPLGGYVAALVTEVETLRAEVARLERDVALCERHSDRDREDMITVAAGWDAARAHVASLVIERDKAVNQRDQWKDECRRARADVEGLRVEVARLEAEAGEACPAEIEAKADLDQARADLAALHAEAVRLRAALDLAERDKAHELVDELMADRDEARRLERQAAHELGVTVDLWTGARRQVKLADADRARLRTILKGTQQIVDQMRPVAEAAKAAVAEIRSRGFSDAVALCAAVDQMAPQALDASARTAPDTSDSWSCRRCGSPRWVAASLTGPVEYGGRAIRQCVSCGRYSNDPVNTEAAPTIDQMPPTGPLSVRQGDDRGEVAGTDTVEAQEGTQPAYEAAEKRGDARLRWMDEIDATDRIGEVGRDA